VNPWSTPETVAGFVRSPPNAALMQFAADERAPRGISRALDIGCGAGRNALPLARTGWDVVGTDTSRPMLDAAARRVRAEGLAGRVSLVGAAMDHLPVRSASADLVIAHGIWNLARSAAEFRRGVREAARAAKPGAALFVFTFSRHTLPADAVPVAGETFVFTQFSGEPQCFLTREQLLEELEAAGFATDPAIPLRELNRPTGLLQQRQSGPVIYEGTFRLTCEVRRATCYVLRASVAQAFRPAVHHPRTHVAQAFRPAAHHSLSHRSNRNNTISGGTPNLTGMMLVPTPEVTNRCCPRSSMWPTAYR
jgi:SAM-dependent methyltransferase